ncbi:MAG: alpha-hydroxy-acid oxidizing protein [Alphaproteobacteria bacterium]|nr:alpha-hydroxy-acid oxidizing protein [Alphaproteobacteria bacterium]MDA8004627.1 alpha-hydroxy-acid oxidizing protein [Alphaproteobacteria bacterium]MDA8005532.1 alpha-hydroxy-acid oxidizing protein [Alphaproteobacteria bacterium]MDA8012982.1 alpha-hydroxy-acid oxidizing protein [Alphaproteobacteria bacterium]
MITCIEDLRILARRRVPRMFYDYVDSGSWSEGTYRENTAALARIGLEQRVLRDISERRLGKKILGTPARIPVGLAPLGMAGMQSADGEIHAARAAFRFGVPFTLSTFSICSLEDVAAAVDEPFWFQLYVMRERDFSARLMERARAAGCSALVLTVDLPVLGQRHKDLRNGLTAPPRLTFLNLCDLARRPRWCLGMARTRRRAFGNIFGHVRGVDDMSSLMAWASQQLDASLSWDDIGWVREHWDGRLVIKGILHGDDARRAAEAGADAVVVSNHGGRQLDGARAAITVLPEVVSAVGDKMEVLFDSGIRSGQDILKALALGADGTLIGRAYGWGLGAMGGAGVECALELLERELSLTMALCGVNDVEDLSREHLVASTIPN